MIDRSDSGRPRSGLSALVLRGEVLVLLTALVVGVFVHRPALLEADRFHDNWRQSPHWISPERQSFHPDDLLLRYARFNTAPLTTAGYSLLARTGIDLYWGKVTALLFFVLTALCVFVTGRAMTDRVGGGAAAVLFLFFPCMFYEFSGGFANGLSTLFL